MNKHLSLRSGNPVLSKSTFTTTTNVTDTMTIEGTVNKTMISLFLLVGTGYFTFDVMNPILLIGCGIGGLIIALITIFKKHWAPITVPIYAVLEGGLLGGVSFMYQDGGQPTRAKCIILVGRSVLQGAGGVRNELYISWVGHHLPPP